MTAPLLIDLFCGLGGWSEGFLADGWDVVGFDITRHHYGDKKYPGQLVLQDILTIHGSQFKRAAAIVASPPCQAYSFMAMPFSIGKKRAADIRADPAKLEQLNALFNACFRIQREASEAAGRKIPLIVENVKGAQPWVGRARANFGSFFLWGDVNSVGGRVIGQRPTFGDGIKAAVRSQKRKNGGGSWFNIAHNTESGTGQNPDGRKVPGMSWSGFGEPGYKAVGMNSEADRRLREGKKVAMNFHEHAKTGKPGRSFQSVAVEGTKGFVTGLGRDHDWRQDPTGRFNSKSSARKEASAEIAKIPFPLSSYLARVLRPTMRG